MQGSIRQRTAGSSELRAFIGRDPATGRRLDRSVTIRGNRTDAEHELAAMIAAARAVRAVRARSTVADLLEAWFAVASTGWAPTTTPQTRSVLGRYLRPHLGHIAGGEVTPALIDATHAELRRRGGMGGRPLGAGTLARVHVVLRAAMAQAMRWGWIWDNPAERAQDAGPEVAHTRQGPSTPRCASVMRRSVWIHSSARRPSLS